MHAYLYAMEDFQIVGKQPSAHGNESVHGVL